VRIVLCDDNRILCEALADVLQARGHLVLAIATTTADGVAAIGEHWPDLCVLDLRFPDEPDGISAARFIRDQHPGTKILVLSGSDEPAAWSQALRIGVHGFLRKDQDVTQIADALDVIAGGGSVFDPSGSRRPVRRAAERRHDPLRSLTPREAEVLSRIVAGQTTQRMAKEMNLATSTLRSYIKNVLAKLGAHSRLQAAAIASRTATDKTTDKVTDMATDQAPHLDRAARPIWRTPGHGSRGFPQQEN
jgi:two-component system nitrate/nitrite response regulator NarL